jgi:hypothetical protein
MKLLRIPRRAASGTGEWELGGEIRRVIAKLLPQSPRHFA